MPKNIEHLTSEHETIEYFQELRSLYLWYIRTCKQNKIAKQIDSL